MSYGEPIYIPRELNEVEFEKMRLQVEEAMLQNRDKAIREAERINKGDSK